jgi:hypothetical protein
MWWLPAAGQEQATQLIPAGERIDLSAHSVASAQPNSELSKVVADGFNEECLPLRMSGIAEPASQYDEYVNRRCNPPFERLQGRKIIR